MKYSNVWFLLLVLGLASCSSQPPRSDLANPKQAAVFNAQLGARYFDQGNLELAKFKLEKALKQDPNLPDAHSAYAVLMNRLGQTRKAEKHFKRALKLDPGNSNTLNNYGIFLCGQDKIEKAEEQFLAALKNPLYRTPEYAYTNAGRCFMKVSNLQRAEDYFNKALRVNPKFSGALLEMAILRQTQNQFREAYQYLQKFEQYGRHTPASLWLGVKLANRLGDKNAQATYALKLKNQFPDSEEAAYLRNAQLHY